MRERTTWNREQISKLAAAAKKADDPRAMNQDHLKEQPAADAYNIGGPSEFAEDVHPSNKTWKAEYSGGEVKRNEIGMPEMRGDTFNHPEKTASEQEDEKDDDFLEKKAEVCIALAKRMLPKTASERVIEDQALAFMHMPDSALIDTATRLAAEEGDDEEEESSQKKEAQGQQQDDKKQSQQQQQDDKKQSQDQEQKKEAQGQQQDDKKQSQQEEKSQDQQDKGQQAKEAGEIPENFKKDDDAEEEKKQAGITLAQQACTALQQGNQQLAQELVQQMAQQQQQQMAQQQQQTMSQQQAEQQVQQMLAQAMQQLSQGQQQQQPAMANDDQLLDQMLQQQEVFATDSSMPKTASGTTISDIQLDGPSMDMSEVKMGSEDEALKVLFASHSEVQDAAQAHTASAGMTRTASRTVGTRPSGGVSQLGGGAGPDPAGRSDVDKLSGLWASAPDVSGVFD